MPPSRRGRGVRRPVPPDGVFCSRTAAVVAAALEDGGSPVAVREGRSGKWGTWEEPLAPGGIATVTTLEAAPPPLIYGAGETSPAGAAYWAAKRVTDLLSSAAGIIALCPLMSLVTLTIKLSSRGPVFFKQTRIGRDGIPFTFYK